MLPFAWRLATIFTLASLSTPVISHAAIPLGLLKFPAPLYEHEAVATCPATERDCLDPGFPDPPPIRSGIDTARLCVLHNVTTLLPQKILVNYTSDECRPNCLQSTMLTLEQKGVRKCVDIDTKYAKHFKFYKLWFGKWESLANFTQHFTENGDYAINLNQPLSKRFQLQYVVNNSGDDAFVPLKTLGFVLLAAFVVQQVVELIWRTYKRVRGKRTEDQHESLIDHSDRGGRIGHHGPGLDHSLGFPDTISAASTDDTASESGAGELLESDPSTGKLVRKRWVPLDALRGLALILMIWVQYGGGGYTMFFYSPWNGLTFGDLPAGWFVFLMGVSMAISLDNQKRTARKTHCELFARLLYRIACLTAMGMLLHNYVATWTRLRYPGTMQRLAFASLLIAPLVTVFPTFKHEHPLRDLTNHALELFVVFTYVAVHTCVTLLLPVPGCPTGYLGPGGISDQGQHWNCTGGASNYIDHKVFGNNHLYYTPSCLLSFLCHPWTDHEGLLGTVTAAVLAYLGVMTGRIFLYFKSPASRVARWLLWAGLTGGIALALTGGTLDGGAIPFNRTMNSLSYILIEAAGCFVLLAVFYVLIDVVPIWHPAPLHFLGSNSLVIFVAAQGLQIFFPFAYFPVEADNMRYSHGFLVVQNAMAIVYFCGIAYVMHLVKLYVAF